MEAVFARYERALMDDDVGARGAVLGRSSDWPVWLAENLYGNAEIAALRQVRSPVGLARRLSRTVITTFGRDLATASTLFHRDMLPGKVSRQMQTWVRLPDIGWRIVAAHISVTEAP